jgi:hypothetical protein
MTPHIVGSFKASGRAATEDDIETGGDTSPKESTVDYNDSRYSEIDVSVIWNSVKKEKILLADRNDVKTAQTEGINLMLKHAGMISGVSNTVLKSNVMYSSDIIDSGRRLRDLVKSDAELTDSDLECLRRMNGILSYRTSKLGLKNRTSIVAGGSIQTPPRKSKRSLCTLDLPACKSKHEPKKVEESEVELVVDWGHYAAAGGSISCSREEENLIVPRKKRSVVRKQTSRDDIDIGRSSGKRRDML